MLEGWKSFCTRDSQTKFKKIDIIFFFFHSRNKKKKSVMIVSAKRNKGEEIKKKTARTIRNRTINSI